MRESFSIQVSRSAFRLRGTATYKGETYRYAAKHMADFDEAIVDGALIEGVDEVTLEVELADGVADAVQDVAASRESISDLLSRREEAIKAAVSKLEDSGWSRRDAARIVGVNQNSLPGILAEGEGGVYGASMLGREPADVGAGTHLVLGRWVRDGDALVLDGDARVSGLSARVRKLWADATGYVEESDTVSDAEDDDAADDETTDITDDDAATSTTSPAPGTSPTGTDAADDDEGTALEVDETDLEALDDDDDDLETSSGSQV